MASNPSGKDLTERQEETVEVIFESESRKEIDDLPPKFFGRHEVTPEEKKGRVIWPEEWLKISKVYYALLFEDPEKNKSLFIRLFPPQNITDDLSDKIISSEIYIETSENQIRINLNAELKKIGYKRENCSKITLLGDGPSVRVYPYIIPLKAGKVAKSLPKQNSLEESIKAIQKDIQTLLKIISEKR